RLDRAHQHAGEPDAKERAADRQEQKAVGEPEGRRAGGAREEHDRHDAAAPPPVERSAERELHGGAGQEEEARQPAELPGVEAHVVARVGGEDGVRRPGEVRQHVRRHPHEEQLGPAVAEHQATLTAAATPRRCRRGATDPPRAPAPGSAVVPAPRRPAEGGGPLTLGGMAVKTLPSRHEVDAAYTWDLSVLYASEEAYRADLERVAGEVEALAGYRGRLGESAATLASFLELFFGYLETMQRLRNYATLPVSVDQHDQEARRKAGEFAAVA